MSHYVIQEAFFSCLPLVFLVMGDAVSLVMRFILFTTWWVTVYDIMRDNLDRFLFGKVSLLKVWWAQSLVEYGIACWKKVIPPPDNLAFIVFLAAVVVLSNLGATQPLLYLWTLLATTVPIFSLVQSRDARSAALSNIGAGTWDCGVTRVLGEQRITLEIADSCVGVKRIVIAPPPGWRSAHKYGVLHPEYPVLFTILQQYTLSQKVTALFALYLDSFKWSQLWKHSAPKFPGQWMMLHISPEGFPIVIWNKENVWDVIYVDHRSKSVVSRCSFETQIPTGRYRFLPSPGYWRNHFYWFGGFHDGFVHIQSMRLFPVQTASVIKIPTPSSHGIDALSLFRSPSGYDLIVATVQGVWLFETPAEFTAEEWSVSTPSRAGRRARRELSLEDQCRILRELRHRIVSSSDKSLRLSMPDILSSGPHQLALVRKQIRKHLPRVCASTVCAYVYARPSFIPDCAYQALPGVVMPFAQLQ